MYFIIEKNSYKVIGNYPEKRIFPNNEYYCYELNDIEITQDEEGNTIYIPEVINSSDIEYITNKELKDEALKLLSQTDFWDHVSYRVRHENDINPSLVEKDMYRNQLRDVVSGSSNILPTPLEIINE